MTVPTKKIPNGEVKRAVSFDMSKEMHRVLYAFSHTINLSEFVRVKLLEERSKVLEGMGKLEGMNKDVGKDNVLKRNPSVVTATLRLGGEDEGVDTLSKE